MQLRKLGAAWSGHTLACVRSGIIRGSAKAERTHMASVGGRRNKVQSVHRMECSSALEKEGGSHTCCNMVET